MEIDKNRLIALLSHQLAAENADIYCASVQQGDGLITKRTPWEDGWNASNIAASKNTSTIKCYLNTLSNEVIRLILEDKLRVSVEGDVCNLCVDSSSLFGWGYSDTDDVEIEDLPDLIKAYEESPIYGGILWVCRKAKMRPQKPYYKYFNAKEIKLFNACGSEKENEDET